MTGQLSWIPAPWIYAVAGVLLTGLVSLVGFVVKKAATGLAKKWDDAMDKLSVIETTTRVQAENHLHTIQTESIKQTELLEKMVVEQASTNGYLKAVVDFVKKS